MASDVIKITGDVKAIQRDLKKLRKKDQPRAIAKALNDSRTTIRKIMVQRISKMLGMKTQKQLRRRIVFGRRARAPKFLWTRIRFLTKVPFGVEVFGKPTQTGSRHPHVKGGVQTKALGYLPGAWIQSGAFVPHLKGMVFQRHPTKKMGKHPKKAAINRVTVQWESERALSQAHRIWKRVGRPIFRKRFQQAANFYITKGRRKR